MDIKRCVHLLLVTMLLLSLSVFIGCATSGGVGVKWGKDKDVVRSQPAVAKKGPPPWAPAHGYRKKYGYRYHYYPDNFVYYDTERGVYFYIKSGNWEVGGSLPGYGVNELGGYVTIDMNTDKPYTYHREHKKKYPPGQVKKGKKKNRARK